MTLLSLLACLLLGSLANKLRDWCPLPNVVYMVLWSVWCFVMLLRRALLCAHLWFPQHSSSCCCFFCRPLLPWVHFSLSRCPLYTCFMQLNSSCKVCWAPPLCAERGLECTLQQCFPKVFQRLSSYLAWPMQLLHSAPGWRLLFLAFMFGEFLWCLFVVVRSEGGLIRSGKYSIPLGLIGPKDFACRNWQGRKTKKEAPTMHIDRFRHSGFLFISPNIGKPTFVDFSIKSLIGQFATLDVNLFSMICLCTPCEMIRHEFSDE